MIDTVAAAESSTRPCDGSVSSAVSSTVSPSATGTTYSDS